MKERILSNWKSSLIGTLLIILLTVILFTSKATFAELSSFYTIAVGLLLAKDSWFKNPNIKILLPFALLLLVSCRTPEQKLNKLINKYPELQHDKEIIIRDTFISQRFDTLVKISLDSFLIKDTLFFTKESLQIQTFFKDKYIYLNVKQKPDTVFKTVKVKVRELQYISEDKNSFKWYHSLMLGIVIGLLAYVILRK